DAMNKLDSEDDWYSLSAIGSKIMAAKPDFDPRSYGHAKLSDMVKALRGLETKKVGTHLQIRMKP
ncbi:MAG: OST-HTH/LOTUS domain-containing protein, partial [Octadecabacter sp.]|nr:OST-HTH/LOTUS domain-containing protein [Octadecabacter sp.]